MHVLIVTFELAGITDLEYRQHVELVAPMFTQVPGLVAGYGSADAATNTYGGVYLFADASSRQDYLGSEIINSMKTNPHFTNLTTREFGTMGEATAITGGPLAASADVELIRI